MTERWKPSVTVAAIVEQVIDGQSRYLLVEEQTDRGLRINNPAGHLDAGESLVAAVAREVLEETARRFEPQALVGIYLSRFHRPGTEASDDITYLRFAFCGTVSEPEAGRALDEGIVRTLWMTPDEVRACAAMHRSPLVQQCIDDHRAGRRYPLQLLQTHPSLYDPWIPG
jgi:8-oxo-dGTP pyrophosphatase MutT (NUDIX family)